MTPLAAVYRPSDTVPLRQFYTTEAAEIFCEIFADLYGPLEVRPAPIAPPTQEIPAP